MGRPLRGAAYQRPVRRHVRQALLLLLRLGAFAAVVWILGSQLTFEDALVLESGETLRGEVVPADEGFEVRTDTGVRRVPGSDVAVRDGGVPDVSYGLATLGRRVAARPWMGALVLLVLAFIVSLMGYRWWALMRAVDIEITLWESIRLTFIGGFFSLVVPGSTGGDVVKAYYAARRSGRTTRAVLSVFVDRLIGVFVLVLVAALALFLGSPGEGFEEARLFVLAILSGGVGAFVVIASKRVRRALGLSALIRRLPAQRVVEEIRAAARLFRAQPRTLLLSLAVSVVNQVGLATVVWVLARALRIEGISLVSCYALVPIANLVAAIPLVPGGWGVGELAFAYFFGRIGVSATEAIGLSVLYRLSFLLVNLPGGLFWALRRDHVSRDRIESVVEEAADHVGELDEAALSEIESR